MNDIIKNLSDGGIYTEEEIATLTNTDLMYVRGVLNNPSVKQTCGDGLGVIYYMDIKYDTIVDGTGFRNTVYCAGCDMLCEGCQNPQSWDIKNGKPISVNNLANLLLENGNDITFSGGECSLQAKAFVKLAQILKTEKRNIWLYSGHTYEELIANLVTKELLDIVDVLVDGKFISFLKDNSLFFKGSSNQRIIDLDRTRKNGRMILWK